MEQKFYIDNFENLLKENVDQFKMYPSKKVWQGIYNNVHPGTRWPSLAMSILFIFTLVIIGHLNTQQSEHSSLTGIQENIQAQKKLYTQANNDLHSESKAVNVIFKNSKQVVDKTKRTNHKKNNINNNDLISNHKLNIAKYNSVISTDNNVKVTANKNDQNTNDKIITTINGENKELTLNDETVSTNSDKLNHDLLENFKTTISLSSLNSTNSLPVNTNRSLQIDPPNINEENPEVAVDPPKSETKKDANVPFLKNRKPSKISWTYYLSPTVSYRNYSKHNASDANETLARLVYTVTTPNFNWAVTHRPSPGIETGTAMKYSLSKKIKFTSGFQVNYSAYTIQANNIHPMMSSLLLYNQKTATPYAISSISYYGNGPGSRQADLHNYSLQLSLPVGFEYKIAGNDYLQLHAAASFQPSFVLANQAYLLSTDKKNYMTYASLSRKWNMSTNIGAFISVNSNNFNWQIGPQVHYQILSSYGKAYSVREHFIDYGVRFGVSKIRK